LHAISYLTLERDAWRLRQFDIASVAAQTVLCMMFRSVFGRGARCRSISNETREHSSGHLSASNAVIEGYLMIDLLRYKRSVL
jgi:hypothetical protein